MPDGRADGATWDDRFRQVFGDEIGGNRSKFAILASEARAAAAWWQAQCQGRDAVIAELNRRVDDLIGSHDRWLQNLERRVQRLEKQSKAGATVVGNDEREEVT